MSQDFRSVVRCVFALVVFLCGTSAPAFTGEAVRGPEEVLPSAQLRDAIAQKRLEIPEFAALRAEAQKRGLRVWLFGGTAAGFAAYVADDLLRAAGHRNYPPEHFAYLLPQVYRPRQDLDLVFDGPADADLASLEFAIAPFLPGASGYRCGAEVRWLRRHYGSKESLLGNAEVLQQSVDSASIGFIELTDPPEGEPVVRDLHRWDDDRGAFLETFASGIVRYLHSAGQTQTARFARGDNPYFVSILRWLGKAMQYRLRIAPEDVAATRLEIGRYDASMLRVSAYGQAHVEKLGLKLFLHAADVSRAYRVARDLGIADKLLATGSAQSVGSAAWWATRKPLPFFEVGQGTGETAHQLGLDVVTHDASNLDSFEALLRAPAGVVNALASRQAVGERAVFGEGFYVQKGNEGAWRTGLNVRCRLRPEAKLNHDFKHCGGDWYVVLNRAALEVISEPLERDPLRFVEVLPLLTASDRGTVERLFRGYRGIVMSMDGPARTAILAQLQKLILSKSSSPYLASFFDVLAEAPFTAEEVRPVLQATQNDPRLYRLLLLRAMRARTVEEAEVIRTLRPTRRWEIRAWARALSTALPAQFIGDGARRTLIALANERLIPWRIRFSILRRLLQLSPMEEPSSRSRWNPVLGARSFWQASALTAAILAGTAYGAVEGITAWRSYLGLPEKTDNGFATEVNLRASARQANVNYDDYVKFTAPLGIDRFPSLPSDMLTASFLPLLRSGDQAQIDARAEIFRTLIQDFVDTHPNEPKPSDRYNHPFYSKWSLALRHAAIISLHGETPIADPRGARAHLLEVAKLASGYDNDWSVPTYSGSSFSSRTVERTLTDWRRDPVLALALAKALAETQKTLDPYQGLHKFWDHAQQRKDPVAFLKAMTALGKDRAEWPQEGRRYRDRRAEWRAPDGEALILASDLAVEHGLAKVVAVAADIDANFVSGPEALAALRKFIVRRDLMAVMESRKNLRSALVELSKHALSSNDRDKFIAARLASLEEQHPCAPLVAQYAGVARLSRSYPWGKVTDEADVSAMIARYLDQTDLSSFTERFEVAASYAETEKMSVGESRTFADSTARREDFREVLAGHFTAKQVTATQFASHKEIAALAQKAAMRAAQSGNPVGFANAYRESLRATVQKGVAAGQEGKIVEQALSSAAKVFP